MINSDLNCQFLLLRTHILVSHQTDGRFLSIILCNFLCVAQVLHKFGLCDFNGRSLNCCVFWYIKTERSKKQVSIQYTMDPFTMLHEDLHPQILLHLTGSDFLKLSEVSKKMYEFTKETNNAKEKILLFINEDRNREFDKIMVEEIKRSYKGIRVHKLFRTRQNVLELFKNFGQFLTYIDTTFDFDMCGVELPKVKSLSMHPYPRYFEYGLLSSVNNLEKLHLSGKTKHPYRIYECLSASPGLKELVLENGAADQTFSFVVNDIGIQLKVFKTNDTIFENHIQPNFLSFMATQQVSLQEFKLLKCDMELLSKLLYGAPNVKRFTFSPTIRHVTWPYYLSFPQVEEINLINISDRQLPVMLSKFPNVKKLYIGDITPYMFRYLLFNVPSLREFRFAHFGRYNFSVHELRTFYQQQKTQRQRNLNENIEVISHI